MKRQEQDHLLNELLTGEAVSDFRQASLARVQSAIRSRKLRRRAAKIAALAMLPVLVAVGFVISHSSHTSVKPMERPAPTVVQNGLKPPSVRVISDEELFALFPGRQMALVGPPGHQKLIFLD